MPPDDLGFIPEAAPAEEKPKERAPANSDVDDIGFVPQGKSDDLGFAPEESTTSTIGAGVEGIAKGLAGPVATAAELGLSKLGVPGLSAEEQAKREEEHPYAEGIGQGVGLIGGAFIPGVGEYTLGSKIGQLAELGGATKAIAKSMELGKVGQTALKLGIEGGLFHLSDNTSKMILGQTDPEAPVSSFLAGLPASMVLGGALGAISGKAGNKIQEMATGEGANKSAQFLADLGNTFGFYTENQKPIEKATQEAQHLYDTVSATTQDAFSLKRESVDKFTQHLTPEQVQSHLNEINNIIEKAPRAAKASNAYLDAIDRFKEATTADANENMFLAAKQKSAADIFLATDQLKRDLGKAIFSHNADPELVNALDPIRSALKGTLESVNNWGDMGKFQGKLNREYSGIQDLLKDFSAAATSSKEGEKLVDEAKIGSVARSVSKGKPLTGFKRDKIADFFEPAKKYLNTIDSLHAEQGIESGIPKVSTSVLDKILEKDISRGAKLGEWLFGAGPGAIGWAGGHTMGTLLGGLFGHNYLGFRAGEHFAPILTELGKRPTRWAVSGLLRALSSGEHAGIPEAINYAEGIHKGAARIDSSVENLFKVGGKQYLNSDHDEKAREKLKKYVEDGEFNQQVQDLANKPAPASVTPQKFAHGGPVLAPVPHQPITKPVPPLLKGFDHVSAVFPEQAMLLGAAKGRINNYLNSIRPQKINAKLPFDEHMPDKQKEKTYDRALDLANKPLSVLDHVKNGTLTTEQMVHMKNLYPEMLSHLQKKVTERMVKAQMANEKPPQHVRQSLSLFMGAALESNLTPANIQAAQSVFLNKKMNQQQTAAKNTNKLSKTDDQYRTPEQSALYRQSSKS